MTGAELIFEERRRQQSVEGWDYAHDDAQTMHELVRAAREYMRPGVSSRTSCRPGWPWALSWWKPSDSPIRNMIKAGALIAAEIDRLQREKGTDDPPRSSKQCQQMQKYGEQPWCSRGINTVAACFAYRAQLKVEKP